MKIQANPFGISERIEELISNLEELEQAKQKGVTKIELTTVNFVTPLSVLPLAVFANDNNIRIECTENNQDVCNYLDTIGFQQGIDGFSDEKKYLPIMKLSPNDEDSDVLGEYENRIINEMKVEKTALKYFTSEIVNNVNEHAKIDHYWILAQYYKTKARTCEIAIADCGIGYKKSYEGTDYQVKKDADAIINALNGKSSKKDWKGRGNGIRSVSKLCVNGFGGKLVIMSGNALLYHKADETKKLKLNSNWKGALVALNFTPKDIEVYKYID